MQSNQLDADLKERVEKAIAKLGFRVTVGQVAAAAGVRLSQAEQALKALAYDSLGNLEVRLLAVGPFQQYVLLQYILLEVIIESLHWEAWKQALDDPVCLPTVCASNVCQVCVATAGSPFIKKAELPDYLSALFGFCCRCRQRARWCTPLNVISCARSGSAPGCSGCGRCGSVR